MKINTPYPEDSIRRIQKTQYAVFKIWNQYNILKDIKRGTDILEITRKPSKTGKHGHENGRVNKSRKPKPEKVKSPVNFGQQKSTTKDKTLNGPQNPK
ncbi:hypothetical protein Tco_0474790 [Tanacetum coccineum]